MAAAKVRLAMALWLLPACSLSWVKGPPPADECTTSKRWPNLDAAGVVAALIGPIVLKATSDSACAAGSACVQLASVSLLGTFAIIPLGISAVVGYNRVEACRELHHRRGDRGGDDDE